MVDGGAHERYDLIAISTPSPLTGQVDLDDRSIAQDVFPAREHLADLGQQLLSAIMLRGRLSVRQRKAQNHLGEGQREILSGSFGNPYGILDLAHRGIVGPQHAKGYSRVVDVADECGVGQGVGAARHGEDRGIARVVKATANS